MIHLSLQERLQEAARQVLPDADTSGVLVRPCPDPKFGDYQCNALISLAKERKLNPRQVATDVLARLDVSAWCEKVELAGAGFINFRLRISALEQSLRDAATLELPFVQKARQPRTIGIDFSSPNVAKPMHVGHVRSTILGDSLARTLRLLGDRVVTDNHIGDWGTQFGRLLVGWKRYQAERGNEPSDIETLVEIYKRIQSDIRNETLAEVNRQYADRVKELLNIGMTPDKAADRIIAELGNNKPVDLSPTDVESRKELVNLQAGDAENNAIWREMLRRSRSEFDEIYARLGVKFEYTLGESFYNPRLRAVVQELRDRGIARESKGAVCVFSDGSLPPKEDPFLVHKDGAWVPNPCLIQKSDGGFNYATTDLATLAHRLETWRPDEIIYVTDGRQQLHFKQIFAVFRRWHPEVKIKLAHVWFGSILGEDGKPFKTRAGDTVKLADLLDEAEQRALKIVSEKNPELSEGQRREIGRVVGIGAVKYADLLPNRQSDYVFSWDKMLALDGNTAPYLLYAYTRTRSLARKARESGVIASDASGLRLVAPEEIALARHLLNFGLVLEAVADEYRPNFLCNYLYELAGLLSRFWERCPVLKSAEPERTSRLILNSLTGSVLKQGLEVLGLETTDQM